MRSNTSLIYNNSLSTLIRKTRKVALEYENLSEHCLHYVGCKYDDNGNNNYNNYNNSF